MPETAAQWVAAGLVAPNSEHLMQAAATPVADAIDALPLQETGTPDYQQTGPAGWSKFFINLTENAVVESLIYNSASYNPALDDVLELTYTNFITSGANSRQFMRMGNGSVAVGGGGQIIRCRTTGTIQVVNNGATALSTLDHRNQVRPYLMPYDRSNVLGLGAGYLGLYTDIERTDGPVDLTSTNSAIKGLGGVGAALAPLLQLRLHCTWYGASARAMFAIGMKTVLQRLRWTVTGY